MSHQKFQLIYQQLSDGTDPDSIASHFQFYSIAPHATDTALRKAREEGQINPQTGIISVNKRDYYRRIILTVDTATKTNERANYTVAQVWAQTADRKHYLLDQIRGKWELPDMTRKVNALAKLHGVDKILVEDKGNGTSYIQNEAGGPNKKRTAPAPVEAIQVPSNQSKEFRFDEITPIIEAGEVFLPENQPWIDLFTREVSQFPEGANDDQVDAMTQYLRWQKTNTARRYGTKKIARHG